MTNSVIIFVGVGIIQSLIFGLLIALKKTKKASDLILLGWFIVFAFHLGMIPLIDTTGFQLVLILAKSITLLHGPFLLLYTFSVFTNQFSKHWLFHLLPFTLIVGISFLIFDRDFAQGWEVIILITKTSSLLGYPLYVLTWLKERLAYLKTTRADSFLIDSQWVKTLASLIFIYAVIGILHVLSNVILEIEFSIILDILFYVAMVTIIGFYGLKFGIVFNPNMPAKPIVDKTKYKHSPLKRKEIVEMRERIDNYFSETDEYLNHDFSLATLSIRLDIKKHHLSEIINLDMGTTFYDIVNAKRVQYAIQRMQEQSDVHITLEGLGYESGFNTKSAFYHHFKNFTGKTPGQFKSEIRPD